VDKKFFGVGGTWWEKEGKMVAEGKQPKYKNNRGSFGTTKNLFNEAILEEGSQPQLQPPTNI
jgi:hypothetical protein